jgi:hypothetical protein
MEDWERPRPPWPHMEDGDAHRFQLYAESAITTGVTDEWPHMILKLLIRVRKLEGKCRSTQFPSTDFHQSR